ncbi:MAG: polyphosphate polymerase domain-containing protein [Oscillospiraceae bacterium]|jgi:SPX domain protein involved in polyphosphate accumulation|nr:polyphosphate polymerase domain-containing protein [Oscillospiraceae bacterium]
MAIDVFSRYENKYKLNGRMFRKVQAAIADNMEADKFNRGGEMYTIRNIYYDAPDFSLIRRSLSKPLYKEKVRLRAYGEVDEKSDVFVEIKKKFSGLVSKRRSLLKLGEAYDFLRDGTLPQIQEYMNAQVLREAQYIIEREKLRPALYLAYERFAYFGLGHHDLRVSFDADIRTRRENVRFEYGDYGEPLLEADTWLMEIKVASSIPVWLCRVLSENGIVPLSFSKYGAEYTKALVNKLNGGEKECSILYFPQQVMLRSA